MGEAAVGQRPHQPEHDLKGGEGAWRQIKDERGQGAAHGGDGDAGEDQGQRAAVASSQ